MHPQFLVCTPRIPQFWKTTTGSQQWVCSERLGCFPICLLRTGQTLRNTKRTQTVPLTRLYRNSSFIRLLFALKCVFLNKHASYYLRLNMERDLGSLILATDISRQNDYLSRFRLHLDQENLCMSTASHRHFVLQVSVGLKKPAVCCISANSRLIFIFAFPIHADGPEVCRYL